MRSTARAHGTRWADPYRRPLSRRRSSSPAPGTTVAGPSPTCEPGRREQPAGQQAGLGQRERHGVGAGHPEHGHRVGRPSPRPRRPIRAPRSTADRSRRPRPRSPAPIPRPRPPAPPVASPWPRRPSSPSRSKQLVGHRSPLAMTVRRISLVPPRMVHDGDTRSARARSRTKVLRLSVRRLELDQALDPGHDVLLELGAQVLADGRFHRGGTSLVDHPGDGERHLADAPPAADHVTEEGDRLLPELVAVLAEEMLDHQVGGDPSLRAGPLEAQLRRVLLPTLALDADQQVVGHEHVVEDDLVELGACRR